MQHSDILKMVETRTHEKVRNWLTRAKALLQSDLWSVDIRLEDRPEDEALQAERRRILEAIDKLDGLL
jgi:hypothetical protein